LLSNLGTHRDSTEKAQRRRTVPEGVRRAEPLGKRKLCVVLLLKVFFFLSVLVGGVLMVMKSTHAPFGKRGNDFKV
jgi:cell division septal protein FtsQ